ncbi:MAG: hypothetical protein A2061_05755 [Gallionellales bacterium GWA2_59_43]|nr:MAG: hypothetical protein A2061_05755 [Gallionellales bacterium GWA2_59_43]
MSHPDFYDEVPGIVLYDPLAAFLGATDDGLLRYGYLDAVRLAGHSCPTVAAAYWSTRKALLALYGDETPVRGDIRVEFGQARASGVTGVIANVVSLLTGAMADDGFKGLGGSFDRRKRLFFSVELPGEMRYTRIDQNRSVVVSVDLRRVPVPPQLPELMASCMVGGASAADAAEFRRLWQRRVRSILLEHGDDPAVFVVTPG